MLGHRKNHGFTLAEFIVVAVLVLILAVILYPVFAAHRPGKVRQTACMHNLRQIDIAINMYCHDNMAAFFPDHMSQAWSVPVLSEGLWSDDFDCPATKGIGNANAPEYGFNPTLFGQQFGDIYSPSSLVILADLAMTNPPPNYCLADFNRDLDYRHNNGVVLLFADGHAGWELAPRQGETPMVALLKKGCESVFFGKPILVGPYTSSITRASGYGRSPYVILPAALFTPTSPKFAIQWDMEYTGVNEIFPAAGVYCSLFDNGGTAATGSGWPLPTGGIAVGFPSASKLDLLVGGQPVASAPPLATFPTTTTVQQSTNITKTGTLTNTILVTGDHLVWYVKDSSSVLGVVEYTFPTGTMPSFRTTGKKMAVYVNRRQPGTTATMKNICVTTF